MSELQKRVKIFLIFNIVFSAFLVWLIIPIIWLVFSAINLKRLNNSTTEQFLELKKELCIALAIMLLSGNFVALVGLWFVIDIPNSSKINKGKPSTS